MLTKHLRGLEAPGGRRRARLRREPLEPDKAAFHQFSVRRVGVKVVYVADPEATSPGSSARW